MRHISQAKGALAALFISVFLGSYAQATLVVPMPVEKLVSTAKVVVWGKVVQMDVDSSTGRRTAVVEASEVVRAPEEFRNERDFYVPLENFAEAHGDLISRVTGAPELVVGEELMLFLDPISSKQEGARQRLDKRKLFALTGFHQGKLAVVTDEQGVRRVATFEQVEPVKVSTAELRAQRTSPRWTPKQGLRAAELRESVEKLRTLDSLLNAVRGAQ